MKWVKKILIGLLVLLLMDMIVALAISFNLKQIIIDGVIREAITERITKKEYKAPNDIISDEQIDQVVDDERVREIMKTPEMQELMNKYLDQTIDGLIDEENINEVEIEKDIVNFLKENKSVIEKQVGKEVTDEMLENAVSQLETKDMSNAYKQAIRNASKNMTKEEKQVLKGYSTIISTKFKIWMFIGILIDLILIALLQKSLYKWIKTFGKTMLVSGVGIVLMSIIVSAIVKGAANINSFNTTNLTITGVVIAILGLIIVIVYKVVEKIIKKKSEDDLDEISEFSEN